MKSSLVAAYNWRSVQELLKFLEHFKIEMSYGFVGEDEAGKEHNRRHIRLYVEVM